MPKTRMESSVRITFLKPQSATGTLFLTPIPQISHLDVFNFYQKSIELGIIFTGPPEEQVWGGIMTHVIDCSGNTFSVEQVENKA